MLLDFALSPLGALGTICVLTVVLYILNGIRLVIFSPLRKIPGPLVTRFSGLYQLSLVATGQAPASYRKVHRKYGKIARVGPNHVAVADPSEIPTIYGLGSKFMKTRFYSVMSPVYKGETMNSMFTERDPALHKALKTPVAQMFSMTNLRLYEPHADVCTDLFITAMRARQGQSIDLALWLQFYAFDMIASITFRRRFGFLEQGIDVNNMIGDMDSAMRYLGVVTQYPSWHPWLMGNRTLMSIVRKISPGYPDPLAKFLEFTEEEIQRYDNEPKQGLEDRADLLAQLRAKEAKDGTISYRDMVNHLSNNLLAGSDTTAISLRAVLYYIIKNPRIYTRIQEEIDEADRQGQLSDAITLQESMKLSYLQATIREALRVHPAIGYPLERYVPSQGATICGHHVPAGTVVSMSAPVVHMDPDIYGVDAMEFRPERWLDSSPEQLKAMDRSFLAFGHGARTCIGKNISLLEMSKFVPSILRKFNLEWDGPAGQEWTTHASWFWKQTDFFVRFEERKRT